MGATRAVNSNERGTALHGVGGLLAVGAASMGVELEPVAVQPVAKINYYWLELAA
jgi:hypothetical protein